MEAVCSGSSSVVNLQHNSQNWPTYCVFCAKKGTDLKKYTATGGGGGDKYQLCLPMPLYLSLSLFAFVFFAFVLIVFDCLNRLLKKDCLTGA